MRIITILLSTFILCTVSVRAQDITINAPNTLSWTTCGAVDDCPYSPSEDRIVEVNIPCAGDWKFSLCGGLTDYNTLMFLSTGVCGGTVLASNDDFCGQYSEFTVNLSVGTYYVAIEGAGGSDCGNFTLFVSDAQPPVIINCQSDITVNNTPNDCGAVVNFSAPSANDNCVLSSFTSNHSSGEFYPVGTTTVIYTATDGAGNTSTCEFDITVIDNQNPVITGCPANITVSNAAGQCGATVSWAVPLASDNCGINSFTTTHSPGAFFPLGTTTVTYTATDNSGNSTTCTFTVTVNDTENPTLTCPADITVNNDAGQCGAIVNYTVSGSDNCPGTITTLASGLASGAFFPVGTTTVSYLITDAASNTASCSFTVTVVDNEAPVFDCPVDFLVCGDNEVVNFSAPDFSDNCPGATVVQLSGPLSGSTLAAGTYTVVFEATDAALNTATCSFDIVVAHNPFADFEYSTSCAGDLVFFNDLSNIPAGSITSYAWNMDDGSGIITLHNPTHQFPATGFYDVSLTVTSNTGCTDTHSETVEITYNPSASFTVANQCAGLPLTFNNTSTIITGSLNYVWNFGDGNTGTGTNPTHTYINAGTFTVTLTATSVDNCSDTYSTTVNIHANPFATFSTTNLQCFGDGSGALNISGYGSLAPYEYSIDGTTFQSSGVFSGLDAGSYTATVSDGNGCQSDYPFQLTQPPQLVSALVNQTNLLCHGDQNGTIQVGTTGGITPIYYTLDNVNFQLSPNFGNLGAGDYTVYVSDANNCATTVDVTLTQPEQLNAVVFSQTNVACFGNISGALELLATGGTAPYQYSINGGQSFQNNPVFNNLAAGNYNIVVKDNNNCQKTLSATITQPTQINFTVSATNVQCFGANNGTIVFNTTTGGTPPYQYSVNNGQTYQSSATFANLAPGNYIVTVKDAANCTSSGGATITQPAQPLSAQIAALQQVLCHGGNSGEVTISTTGGTEAYTYSVDGGQNFFPNHVIGGFAAGNHTVIVSDFNGCQTTLSFTLTEPSEDLRIDLVTAQNVNCYNDGSGTIGIFAAGGTPAYEYSINGGTSFQQSQNFTAVPGGTHNIVVRDANGCTVTDAVTTTEPIAPVNISLVGTTSVSCENVANGSITVSGSGGTAPYLFFLNGGTGQLSGSFTGLAAGIYTLLVKDLNGCQKSIDVTVGVQGFLPHADFSYQVAGQSVAFQNLTANGQAFTWYLGDGTISAQTNPVHLYPSPGQYTVKLVAQNTCGSDSVIKNISTIIIGVQENENDLLKVYPNPASDFIVVEVNPEIANPKLEIAITDMAGQIINRFQISDFKTQLDISSLANGIYLLECISENQRSAKRIMISR